MSDLESRPVEQKPALSPQVEPDTASPKRRPPMRVAIILGLVIIGLIIWRTEKREAPPTNELYGNGIIETTEVNISAKVAGKIAVLRVDEGDPIRVNDIVAELDSEELAAQVQQAQAQYDLVLAGPRIEQIEQLRAGVRQAEVALADAERELRRLQGLEEQGAIARQQVDLQRTRRDSAAAQLDATRQRLREANAGARPEEKAAAEAALKVAKVLFSYTTIRCPVSGVVVTRSAEMGELVTPGMPIVRVSVVDRPWLRVYIPEPDLGRVKLGQRADVKSDTYPNKEYAGHVVEIAEQPEFTPKNVQTREERVKLVFGVKIEVENSERELKPGMPADAVIHLGP